MGKKLLPKIADHCRLAGCEVTTVLDARGSIVDGMFTTKGHHNFQASVYVAVGASGREAIVRHAKGVSPSAGLCFCESIEHLCCAVDEFTKGEQTIRLPEIVSLAPAECVDA